MDNLIANPLFGILLILSSYLLGGKLHKRWPIALFTPLAFSIYTIIFLLTVLDISYDSFQNGGQFIDLFITPATVALAIVLEKNFNHLKKNIGVILAGISLGIALHTVIIFSFSLLFQFDESLFFTFFPKSVTTPIALGVAESSGGLSALTVTLVILTGILGSVVGPSLFHYFSISDPIAQGIALGSSAHAMGTSKAIQLGDKQGAMAGLAIVLTGLIIVFLAPLMIYIASFVF